MYTMLFLLETKMILSLNLLILLLSDVLLWILVIFLTFLGLKLFQITKEYYYLSVDILLTYCIELKWQMQNKSLHHYHLVLLLLQFGLTTTDPIEYHTVIGILQYLLLTHSNIYFAISKLSQFRYQPSFSIKSLLSGYCDIYGTLWIRVSFSFASSDAD